MNTETTEKSRFEDVYQQHSALVDHFECEGNFPNDSGMPAIVSNVNPDRLGELVIRMRREYAEGLEAIERRAGELATDLDRVRESCQQLRADESAGRMCFRSAVASGRDLAEKVAKLETIESEMGLVEGALGVRDVK